MMDAPLPVSLMDDWRAALALTGSYRVPKLADAVFEVGCLFPLQRKLEMASMLALAREIGAERVLEIGADKGGSFFHWIRSVPTVTFACAIEIRGVPYVDLFREHFGPGVEIEGIAASSLDPVTLDAVRAMGPFDCVFIDGDKLTIAEDFAAYAPLVRRGGIVFIHDIFGEALPAKFWADGIGESRPRGVIIDTSEGLAAKRREARGEPADSGYEGWLRIWARTSCGVGFVEI